MKSPSARLRPFAVALTALFVVTGTSLAWSGGLAAGTTTTTSPIVVSDEAPTGKPICAPGTTQVPEESPGQSEEPKLDCTMPKPTPKPTCAPGTTPVPEEGAGQSEEPKLDCTLPKPTPKPPQSPKVR
jgi:hypothetical protein